MPSAKKFFLMLGLGLGLWAGCGNSGPPPNPPAGQAFFTWELRSIQTQQPAGCAAGDQVTFDFGGGFAYTYACTEMRGTTDLIVAERYNVTARLTSSNRTVVSETPTPIDVTIPANGVSQPYHVTFSVPP